MNIIDQHKSRFFCRLRVWFSTALLIALAGCIHSVETPDQDVNAKDSNQLATPGVRPLPSTDSSSKQDPVIPTEFSIKPNVDVVAINQEHLDERRRKRGADIICRRVGAKLASIEYDECNDLGLTSAKVLSINGAVLVFKRYLPQSGRMASGRVLVLGGTHGDELTSVSVVFKWMANLEAGQSGQFEWLVAPLINPDGALDGRATRTNARGIDLNRNLPTPDWPQKSRTYWESTGKVAKFFPGNEANSEPESRWVVSLIEQFKPDVIISVHAPLHHVDFDALDRSISPLNLGILKRNLQGTFPGSLGNYAGMQRGIPVITLELPHSWAMPSEGIITGMWTDMVQWLKQNMREAQAQRSLLAPTLAIKDVLTP